MRKTSDPRIKPFYLAWLRDQGLGNIDKPNKTEAAAWIAGRDGDLPPRFYAKKRSDLPQRIGHRIHFPFSVRGLCMHDAKIPQNDFLLQQGLKVAVDIGERIPPCPMRSWGPFTLWCVPDPTTGACRYCRCEKPSRPSVKEFVAKLKEMCGDKFPPERRMPKLSECGWFE